MKKFPCCSHLLQTSLFAVGCLLAATSTIQAHPYASGVTPKDSNGFVSFIMNEDGAAVTVTFDDLTSTNLGLLPKGLTNFYLGSHISYSISCYKQGTGVPSIISSEAVGVYTYSNSVWNSPRGVAVNKNPAIGTNFGRLVVGNSAVGSQSSGPKGQGLYLLNSDQTYVKGPIGTSFFAAGGANSPWRIRANDDGTFLVNDFSTANASLLQFSPDLSSSNLVLAFIGQTAAAAAGIHGDFFGCGILKGSLAQGNLVLYTFDPGMSTPADTNCIKGPLTGPGSYNCVFKYNIGAGPLPWNKRPDYAYTMGLDGIAELRTEGDVGSDGKIYCAFGRANASNPNLQILAPPPTTNGIINDPINMDIQNAAKSATNWLYTGGVTPPFNTPPNGTTADPWVGLRGSGTAGGTYGGVRVSPDGKLIASLDINNGVTLATLANGIPNDGTIFGIDQGTFPFTAPAGITGVGAETGNARGMDWDPANNLWVISSGQGLLRCFSLGLTTTCITSNDWTGTNGTFQLVTPPSSASVVATTPTASQNYINNTVNPGAPIPGVFRIGFFNSSGVPTPAPSMVGFVRSGTAVYGVNYIINTNEMPSGVVISNDFVIFPAGVPAGNTMTVDVKIIPTATPVSGPTLTVGLRLSSGTNYSAAAPLAASIAILNTGPQLLQLSNAAPTTLGGMNRGIPNDYARFVITRWGDTNGPNNDAVNLIVARTLTINSIRLLPPAAGVNFMANYPADYTAGPQNFTGSLPVDGLPGIIIPPGAVTVNAMIGNPVKHLNANLTRTNLQVVVNLTNTVPIGTIPSTTNVLSGEGYPYSVATTSLTLNEFDNALGGEVLLWSNPLTNSFDSTNWTLVHASINQGASPTLPTVISNYDNSASFNGLPYYAAFGKSVNDPGNDSGVDVPPSATMVANGWTSALKVSVNKDPGSSSESGINLYPQIPGAPWNDGTNFLAFKGNYALRFDMYLHLYDFGLANPTIGTPAREFAAFGINHRGTNANWRLDINPRADGTGARPVNADGEWCVIGPASGSITPADYEMYISPPWALFDANGVPITNTVPFTTNLYVSVPFTNAYQNSPGDYSGATNIFANAGVPNGQQSVNNNAFGGGPQNGIIKNPPFSGINNAGGAPANAWVDVSLELTRQTNLTLKVAQQAIFTSSIINPVLGTANPIAPFTGTPMLGYLDPNRDISDYSAFVYYSNIRVVELSPFIPWTNQPVAGLIVTQGASFSLSSGAMYASNPLTNVWYLGSTNGAFAAGSRENGTPTAPIATNVFASTSGSTTLSVNGIQSGTNYVSVWSDQAGSVTNYISVIEVIPNPASKTILIGGTTNLTVVPSGNAPPTSYRWTFSGTNLVNSAHYAGVTTATLWLTNVAAADEGVYSCVVSNANGSVVVAGTLSVSFGFSPYQFTGVSDLGALVGMAFMTANPLDSISSFTLQSAGIVTGPYTNYPFGIFSGVNPNFLVTVPKTNTMMYFRLKHN